MNEIAKSTGSGSTLGEEFAEALGRKDFDRISTILHPQVDFRAVTPRRAWEASDAQTLVEEVLRKWFGESVEIERIISIETDSFADRQRLAYRFQGRNSDGPFVIEQQAYFSERDGRLGWMRLACSGFRPR